MKHESYHKDGLSPREPKGHNGPRLTKNTIFVFGSNLAGIHGAGAAREAYDRFGAQMGNGCGLRHNSYAVPTKDRNLKSLTFEEIKRNVEHFVEVALEHSAGDYFITRVGCGLAGYKDEQIAPLFRELVGLPNVSFPDVWQPYLEVEDAQQEQAAA